MVVLKMKKVEEFKKLKVVLECKKMVLEHDPFWE